MAGAPRDIKNFKENLLCAICLDSVKDPRKLPCDHSFCNGCLEKHIEQNRVTEFKSFPCPSCRAKTEVKNGQMSNDKIAKSFPKNAFLAEMESKVRAYESNSSACDRHDGIPAQYVCITDMVFLCSDCAVKTHRKEVCHVLSVSEAVRYVDLEKKSLYKMCDVRIKDMQGLLSEEEKKNLLEEIKTKTLKDIEEFLKEIEKTVQRIYEDADKVKKAVDTIEIESYESEISKLLSYFGQQKNRISKLGTDSQRVALNALQDLKEIKKELFQMGKLLNTLSYSFFVKNPKIQVVMDETFTTNLVGSLYSKGYRVPIIKYRRGRFH